MTGIVLGAALLFCGASYRGVEVDQRDDFLPPEFDQVARGEFRAQFDNELMQVFSSGALVTGFKVIPLAPMTLAEAVAAHSPGVSAGNLQILLDFNLSQLGVADVANRIAYFTHSVRPESVVRAVGYYNQQTAVMVMTTPMAAQDAEALVTAARNSVADAINHRPQISSLFGQANYLVNERTEAARRQAQRAMAQLKRLRRICTGTPSCEADRRNQAYAVIGATSRFLNRLARAQRVYQANAALVGETPPDDLMRLEELSDTLVQQVRAAVGQVRFNARR